VTGYSQNNKGKGKVVPVLLFNCVQDHEGVLGIVVIARH